MKNKLFLLFILFFLGLHKSSNATLNVGSGYVCLSGSPKLPITETVSVSSMVSSNTAVATVSQSGPTTGNVSAVSVGTATITCSNGDWAVITVVANDAAISSTAVLNASNDYVLWSGGEGTPLCNIDLVGYPAGGAFSGTITPFTVTTGGNVSCNGTCGSTYTVTYISGHGCKATTVVSVDPLRPINGTVTSLCVGATRILTDVSTSGGTTVWSASNGNVTIDASSGSTTAIAAPSSIIKCAITSMGTGCYKTATLNIISNTTAITGTRSICYPGTTALSSSTSPSGGAWSSSNTGVATVNTSGVVTAVSTGTSTISYTLSSGCFSTATVTVYATPSAITGTLTVCTGATTNLTNAAGTGTWTSGSTGVATVSGTGVVTGISNGTSIITYANYCGSVTATVTVSSISAILGNTTICILSKTQLSDATAGGTWSSSNTAVGTVDATGLVTGLTAGTTVISYTTSGGCYVTATVTVGSTTRPNIGCYSDGSGDFAFENDVNGYSGITVLYTADITNATTMASVNAVPVSSALSIPSGAFTHSSSITIADLTGSYTAPPWSIYESHLVSVTYNGCTWAKSCSGGFRLAPGSTGVNTVILNGALSVVPNPNGGTFTVQGAFAGTTDSKDVKIAVEDMLGKIVYRDAAIIENGGINKEITLGNNIPNGIYLIRISNDKSSKIIRFSINR